MQNAVGKLPEYGAIFMSNSVTIKECLQRKLFGLPSSHRHFVEHIRDGMILFLFEYERRELHGVFQACSDGRMDIVPRSFISSGMHCPAQVKFKFFWVCDPLPEHEFRDAIKDNYFTRNKFSFGLSETQVRRLLHLFRSKVLRVPKQRLFKSRNEKLAVQSMDEMRLVEGSRSKVHNRLHGATTSGYSLLDNVEMENSKYQFTEAERVPNDGEFLTNDEFQTKCTKVNGFELRPSATNDDNKILISGSGRSYHCPNTQLPLAISTEYSNYHSGDVQRAQSGVGLRMNYDFQNEYDKHNGFDRPHYSYLSQPKLGRSSFSAEPLGIANSVVPNQAIIAQPPSLACHQMESQLLPSLSTKASYRDAVVTSIHPKSSVDSRLLNYNYPMSNDVNYRSTTERDQPNHGCSENVISSSMQQPSLYLTKNGMEIFGDKISTLGKHASFSGPSPSENAYDRTVAGLSRTKVYQNLNEESIKNQFCDNLSSSKFVLADSSSKFVLADAPSPRARINGKDNTLLDYPLNTNMYPSSLDTYGCRIEPMEQLRYEAAQRREIRESLMGNAASQYENPYTSSEYEDPYRFQAHPSFDPQSLQSCEPSSFEYEHYQSPAIEYDYEHYQSPESYYSGSRRNRASVFSRLALASDEYPPEHNATVSYEASDMSMSVDGIMKMLNKNKEQWVKPNKLNQWNRKYDDEKLKDKIGATGYREADVVLSKSSPKDIKMDRSLARPDRLVDSSLASVAQTTQSTEAEPFLDFKRRSKMQKLHDDPSSRLEAATGGQKRKRKLVRPDFRKNDFPNESDTKNCALQAPAKEAPSTTEITGGCNVPLGNQDNKTTLLSPTRQRLCIEPVGAKAGKESPSTISGKSPDIQKDTDCSDSIVQELPKEGAETADKSGAKECEINNETDLPQSAQSVDESEANNSGAKTDEINSLSSEVTAAELPLKTTAKRRKLKRE